MIRTHWPFPPLPRIPDRRRQHDLRLRPGRARGPRRRSRRGGSEADTRDPRGIPAINRRLLEVLRAGCSNPGGAQDRAIPAAARGRGSGCGVDPARCPGGIWSCSRRRWIFCPTPPRDRRSRRSSGPRPRHQRHPRGPARKASSARALAPCFRTVLISGELGIAKPVSTFLPLGGGAAGTSVLGGALRRRRSRDGHPGGPGRGHGLVLGRRARCPVAAWGARARLHHPRPARARRARAGNC